MPCGIRKPSTSSPAQKDYTMVSNKSFGKKTFVKSFNAGSTGCKCGYDFELNVMLV